MAQLKPIQIAKLNPIQSVGISGTPGAIDPGVFSGLASIGAAGRVNTPQVAKPVFNQFVAQDASQYEQLANQGIRLGQIITAKAIEQAKLEGEAEGRQIAAAFKKGQDSKLWGTGDQPGLSALSGREYIDKSVAFEEAFEVERMSIAKTLDEYSRAEFLAETDKYRTNTFSMTRKQRVTAHQAEIENGRKQANEYNVDILGRQAIDTFRSLKTHDPAELNLAFTPLFQAYREEFIRRESESQSGEQFALEFLEHLYTMPGGHVIAQELTPVVKTSVDNTEIIGKIDNLYKDFTERQYKELKAREEYDQAYAAHLKKQNYNAILADLKTMTHQGQAQALVQDAFTTSEEYGVEVQNLVKTFLPDKDALVNYDPSAAAIFTHEMITKGIDPLNANSIAHSRGITVKGEDIKSIGLAYRTQVGNILKDHYGKQIEGVVERLAAASGFDLSLWGYDPTVKSMVTDLKSRWTQKYLQWQTWPSDAKEKMPVDQLFNDFMSNQITIDTFNYPGLKFSKDKTIFPAGVGSFEKVSDSNIGSYVDVANAINLPSAYRHMPGIRQEIIQIAAQADAGDLTAVRDLQGIWYAGQREALEEYFNGYPGSATATAAQKLEIPLQWFEIQRTIVTSKAKAIKDTAKAKGDSDVK